MITVPTCFLFLTVVSAGALSKLADPNVPRTTDSTAKGGFGSDAREEANDSGPELDDRRPEPDHPPAARCHQPPAPTTPHR